jgi:endogenous inhibitor of DNA gyrase (YacG/DUF329 family)
LPRAGTGAKNPRVHIRCPICARTCDIPDDAPHRPFCSARCKTIDLGNWLGEAYRISRPISADDEDPGVRGEN